MMQRAWRSLTLDRTVDSIWRHSKDAWRGLRRDPALALVTVVLLGLGGGLNAAAFSVVNAVFYRPLAVQAPHELAFVWRDSPRGDAAFRLGPYEHVRALWSTPDLFVGGAGVEIDTATFHSGGEVERAIGERVSANYFELLGVTPVLGRTLAPSDGAPGAERVIVLSDALWRRYFNADPTVIGQQVSLGTDLFIAASGPRYTVVGVVGPQFTGVSNPLAPSQYWVEFTHRENDQFGVHLNRTVHVGMAVMRLRPGVSLERVHAFLSTIDGSDPHGSGLPAFNDGPPFLSHSPPPRLPFGAGSLAPARLGAGVMMVAALVLAVVGANLAGLVAARHVVRHRDVSIRLALGATHWQIARQWLTETLILAAIGGGVSLVLSRVLVTALLDHVARWGGSGSAQLAALHVPIDIHVLGFTMLLCIATGVVASLATLRQLRGHGVAGLVADEGLNMPAGGRLRRRHWIQIPQLALSLALMVMALMAVRAFWQVALVPSGYQPERAAYLRFEQLFMPFQLMSPAQRAEAIARLRSFPRRVLETAQAQPGIAAAAVTRSLPTHARSVGMRTREGRPFAAESAWITPGYFRVMGIPLLRGREFNEEEVANERPLVVVDEHLASRLWPDQPGLGEFITLDEGHSTPRWHEVVGIVGAIRSPLSEGDTRSIAYLPWQQQTQSDVVLVARGHGQGSDLLASLRTVARQSDEGIGVIQSGMVSELVEEQRYYRRLAAAVLGFCALGGVGLAGIGLYGALSYGITQRRREFGVRLALGAQSRDIKMLVIRDGIAVACIASALGLSIALLALRTVSHYLLPLPPVDATTMCLAPLIFVTLAFAVSYVPARRATRAEAAEILRRQ